MHDGYQYSLREALLWSRRWIYLFIVHSDHDVDLAGKEAVRRALEGSSAALADLSIDVTRAWGADHLVVAAVIARATLREGGRRITGERVVRHESFARAPR
jgi:hypothetical protein